MDSLRGKSGNIEDRRYFAGTDIFFRCRGDIVHFEEAGGVEEATPREPTRLEIADDHALVREGPRTMLTGEDHHPSRSRSKRRTRGPLPVLRPPTLSRPDGREDARHGRLGGDQEDQTRDTPNKRGDGHHAREPRLPLRSGEGGAAGYVLNDASGDAVGGGEEDPGRELPPNQDLAMRLLVRRSRESSGGVKAVGRMPR